MWYVYPARFCSSSAQTPRLHTPSGATTRSRLSRCEGYFTLPNFFCITFVCMCVSACNVPFPHLIELLRHWQASLQAAEVSHAENFLQQSFALSDNTCCIFLPRPGACMSTCIQHRKAIVS